MPNTQSPGGLLALYAGDPAIHDDNSTIHKPKSGYNHISGIPSPDVIPQGPRPACC
jgi:hypothetical protein